MKLNSLYFDVVKYALSLCVFITLMVFFYLVFMMGLKGLQTIEVPSESSTLEFFWTFMPSMLVLMLCIYNVSYVLKDFEMVVHKTVKIIGRQWYWSYEYEDYNYDSYMNQLMKKVDKPLKLNVNKSYRLLVTSSDVIHSFSVPDLAIKCDAMPGRINQVMVMPDYLGVFTGYCSELCGAGHSYMPMVVEVVK